MSLIVQPFRFANAVTNLSGAPAITAPGTGFTGGNANVDGTVVQLLSALAFDVHYLVVGISGTQASAVDHNCLADILVDPAGGTSWASFIDDLTCGFYSVNSTVIGMTCWFYFPIFIKSGTSMAIRVRSASAGMSSGRCIIYAMGNPSRPDRWWCGSKVESLGINAASSKGTNVTPGNTGAWGSWTTIGTSTLDYGAVQFGINGSDATATAAGYYWEFGYGSLKLAGSPKIYRPIGSTEGGSRVSPGGPLNCNVPAGTIWQARAMGSGTSEVINAAVYGVS